MSGLINKMGVSLVARAIMIEKVCQKLHTLYLLHLSFIIDNFSAE